MTTPNDRPIYVPYRQSLPSVSRTIFREDIPAFAQAHRDRPSICAERDDKPRHVAHLVRKFRLGLYVPFVWVTAEYDNVVYRINGFNSSSALLECADSLPVCLSFHLDHFFADSRDALTTLFQQYDDPRSSRTQKDVAGVFHSQNPELAAMGLSRQLSQSCADGIQWYQKRVAKLSVPPGNDKYTAMSDAAYLPFFQWFSGIMNPVATELDKIGVIAAMFATFAVSPHVARQFWEPVSRGTLTIDTDPRYVLANCLQRTHARPVPGREAKPDDVRKPEDYYKKSIKAWDLCMRNTSATALRIDSIKGLPKPMSR